MNFDRLKHSYAVGKKMMEIGLNYNLNEEQNGEITDEYESLYLNILNQADMQIDKYGNDVGYEKRLDDIESRYGSDSDVYGKCYKLVSNLKIK